MTRRPLRWLALWLLFLHGCSINPVPHERLPQGEMARIAQTYRLTVQAAHADRETHWHNGPIGNMVVNFWGEPNAGLCFQWQKLVYQGVHRQARELGWQALGIRINKGTDHEHHAVVVFDPDRIREQQLLSAAGPVDAYVLDPWRSGEADIYTLADWLTLPARVEVPAELKALQPQGEE